MESCRICFETDGELYHPCKCDGTIKYVHTHCVLQWLQTRETDNQLCELCKEPYLLKYDRLLEKDILTPPSRSYLLINPTWHIIAQCVTIIFLQHFFKASYSIETYYLITQWTYHILYLTLSVLYVRSSVKQQELYYKYLMEGHYPFLIFVHFFTLFLLTTLYMDKFRSIFVIVCTANQCYLIVYPIIHTSILSRINQERIIVLKNRYAQSQD
jgi:hypothetical protein